MRPLPELTPENTAFWTGGARGELTIAFCADCAHAIHPPQLICPKCWNEAIEFKAVPGTGTVYSFTVNHQQWAPGMAVPFALAVVDIDGAPGVRVTAEVVNTDPESVHIGQAVRATFLNIDDIWFPQWEPAI
ncbi:MAG TPA: OB-fold domain-containing protein [Sphingopyxis sp.]|nr:OB-fold domain-containing protein [Sphingopyxis sp.]HMP46475.1 OB-fold domain-containing protein [Sphingopyxis sp.]HMQ18552.1 OB-fold domain-containing protein [Sphingopyxis sp.]